MAFAVLAEEYRRAGRFEEAIAACSAGLLRHPAYLSAHVTLGRSLIEVGRFDEARGELEYVLKLAPENLAAIRGLAEIHDRSDDDHAHHTAALDEHVRNDAASAEAPSAPEQLRSEPAVAAGQQISGFYDPPPNQPVGRIDPALAGLEAFLGAIERTRDERAAAR